MRRTIWSAVLAAVLLAGSVQHPMADETAQKQLAGRTLDVIVAFSNTGGGARFWGIFSDALKKRLPDTVIRGRFDDAGSGTSAANTLFAMPEGSLAVGFARPAEVAFAQAEGREDVHYDLAKANFIQAVELETQLMVGRRGLPTDIAELRKLRPTIPVHEITDTASIAAIMLNAITGVRGRIVVGFDNASRTRALVTGEADMYTQSIDGDVEPLLASGEVVSVYVIAGTKQFANVDASKTLAGVTMPGVPEALVDYLVATRALGRAFYAPPGVSAADVDALRTVFREVTTDPEFIAAAGAQKVPVAYVPGVDVGHMIDLLLLNDPVQKAQVQHAYECGMQMSQGTLEVCDFGAP